MTYLGEERRVNQDDLLYRIEQLEISLGKLEAQINSLLAIWEQSRGAWKAVKLFFYVTAPLVAATVWIKDHVKF